MSTPFPQPTVEMLRRRVRVALGQEPGDLLLTGGNVVNVFTERIEPADVVIADGWIAGVGPYDWEAAETVSLDGHTILPGLIDAHMHLESTLLLPSELARLIVPRGTSAVIADPHEIANVSGVAGVERFMDLSDGLPLDVFFMAPSCVPACPWESPGATLDSNHVVELMKHPRCLGLAEMMNFPGVLAGDREVMKKIAAAQARGLPVDGHAPGLSGRDLVAYAAAGIRSDHECFGTEEAKAKADLGMLVQVREGSSARNLDTFLPLLAEDRLGDWCLATDDIHVDDLMDHGHLDWLLRRVVAARVPPARAVRHASLIPARHYGLTDRGAVAPGYRADLFVTTEATDFEPHLAIKDGQIVAREGRFEGQTDRVKVAFENTVRLAAIDESAFVLRIKADEFPVIGLVPGNIVTRREVRPVRREDGTGRWLFDPEEDVAKIACIERHQATGRIGVGLVAGFGFRKMGALGSSVAHDAHNLVIAGTDASNMLVCARALEECGGGLVVVSDGSVLAKLPLPVAGLISDLDYEAVRRDLDQVTAAARSLGCQLPAPFGTLSFLCLSVIPELRITDRGLFDVVKQQLVEP